VTDMRAFRNAGVGDTGLNSVTFHDTAEFPQPP